MTRAFSVPPAAVPLALTMGPKSSGETERLHAGARGARRDKVSPDNHSETISAVNDPRVFDAEEDKSRRHRLKSER
jgi:hypothetical protein